MKAEAKSLTFLGPEGAVKIPFFQRSYVWDKYNWEDLLIDLLDNQKTPFLGSLILKPLIVGSGNAKGLLVIDGQQRLTTLSILLKALYDLFPDNFKKNSEQTLNLHLFYKENPTDETQHIKIIHSQLDRKYYEKVILGDITTTEYNSIVVADEPNKIVSKDNKILQCYKFFKEELKNKTVEQKTALFNSLLNQNNKYLVIIDLFENEDEQAIFDTINSAGVRLSSADIIKNALFQKALVLLDNNEEMVIKIYNTYWESIFSTDDNTKA
jgi:uncharacterized protein with ParB-like and HNH nuclease domain